MSKLYTYIVRNDTGLAPNPFWGYCTLAVCTPNHQGSRVKPNEDWIAGFLEKKHGYKFIYAMEVSERVHMHSYFNEKRFSEKIPQVNGSWMQRCGDNFYSQDELGQWQQHETLFHEGTYYKNKDTKNPRVFVAKRFWYLGREAAILPEQFKPLVGGRGARVNHPDGLPEQFKDWVQQNFAEGLTALPRDIEQCGCGSNPTFERDCAKTRNPSIPH